MTSDQNAVTTEPASQPDELTLLKQRATAMGITFHPTIGVEKLRAKVEARRSTAPPAAPEVPVTPAVETIQQRNARLRKEASQLIRVKVKCMNPNKKEWEGEIFTVSNSAVGTFKKYVPFNAEDGWHVPQIMLNMIRERQYQTFVTTTGPRGEKSRKGKLVPEFAVELLDPLTPNQLQELAQRQAMAGSIDSNQ